MDAWRRVTVPAKIVGKTNDEIRDWARAYLRGQEPDLSVQELKRIREGTTREVVLKPRKAGFFLPNGEFVEALGSIKLSEGLDEADRTIDLRERDNEWADAENDRFRQGEKRGGRGNMRALWEHGRRIHDYVTVNGRPPFTIHKLLAARGGAQGFSLHTHQTASQLYGWRPQATEDDPIFGWTWELVDAVLKFVKDNKRRDAVVDFLRGHLLDRGVPMGTVAVFLRGPDGNRGDLWRKTDVSRLASWWETLRERGTLPKEDADVLQGLLRAA